MIDVAWGQLCLIMLLALILLGPKEMVASIKAVGRWVGYARLIAQEFYRQIDAITDQDLDQHG